jgi:hypothetical protein
MGKINQASENVLYWKQFVETWNEFYKSKKGESYVYQKKDFACLKKIYSFLKKRSEKKEYEWTENNVINGFFFFFRTGTQKRMAARKFFYSKYFITIQSNCKWTRKWKLFRKERQLQRARNYLCCQ